MSYQDILTELSEGTATLVGQLWALVENGTMERSVFTSECAFVVAVARRRGEAAAVAALRASLEAWTQSAAAITHKPPADDLERLQAALGTILDSDLDTAMQLARLAANEPLEAANDAFTSAMESTALVSGWKRRLEPDACQLCMWWWRDGRVFQKTHKMPRHTGCTCHQEPVLERTTNFQSEKQAGRAAVSQATRERNKS